MRELKFRQPIYSNGEFKEFWYWGCIGDDFTGKITHRPIGTTHKPDEQYIGIKDCDDDGIYEGDCVEVEINNSYQITSIVGQVVYSLECCAFVIINKNDSDEEYWLDLESMHIQIIGNIHQNPELL